MPILSFEFNAITICAITAIILWAFWQFVKSKSLSFPSLVKFSANTKDCEPISIIKDLVDCLDGDEYRDELQYIVTNIVPKVMLNRKYHKNE